VGAGLAGVLIWVAAALPNPAAAAEGATIWGDDYRSTVRAMKVVMRSLGLKSCLHCHVKAGGKMDYEAETANKDIARLMKSTFVDSLVAKGQGEVLLEEEGHSNLVSARFVPGGKETAPAILLTVVRSTTADSSSKTFEGRIELEPEAQMSCATCHGGTLHFLTQAEGD
jgi:hypothetical protein